MKHLLENNWCIFDTIAYFLSLFFWCNFLHLCSKPLRVVHVGWTYMLCLFSTQTMMLTYCVVKFLVVWICGHSDEWLLPILWVLLCRFPPGHWPHPLSGIFEVQHVLSCIPTPSVMEMSSRVTSWGWLVRRLPALALKAYNTAKISGPTPGPFGHSDVWSGRSMHGSVQLCSEAVWNLTLSSKSLPLDALPHSQYVGRECG